MPTSLGSAAKDEVGYTPGYARNVELGTVRLIRNSIIVRSLVFRGRIGFVDSLDDLLQSQVGHSDLLKKLPSRRDRYSAPVIGFHSA